MKDVCIIIPIYHEFPTDLEVYSLNSLKSKNTIHTIKFICPDSGIINEEAYRNILNNATFEKFDSAFFESTIGYSNLLTSAEFYERFSEYEYILIFQTDCLAFDGIHDLSKWVEKDFDYVGSPIIGNRTHWPSIPCCGNGGLSLRKVSKFISLCKNPLISKLKENKTYEMYEDVLFCMGFPQYVRMDLPAWDECAEFSWDMNPDTLFRKFNKLPEVGCHAWPKNIPFWKDRVKFDDIIYKQAYDKHKIFINAYYHGN